MYWHVSKEIENQDINAGDQYVENQAASFSSEKVVVLGFFISPATRPAVAFFSYQNQLSLIHFIILKWSIL